MALPLLALLMVQIIDNFILSSWCWDSWQPCFYFSGR